MAGVEAEEVPPHPRALSAVDRCMAVVVVARAVITTLHRRSWRELRGVRRTVMRPAVAARSEPMVLHRQRVHRARMAIPPKVVEVEAVEDRRSPLRPQRVPVARAAITAVVEVEGAAE